MEHVQQLVQADERIASHQGDDTCSVGRFEGQRRGSVWLMRGESEKIEENRCSEKRTDGEKHAVLSKHSSA